MAGSNVGAWSTSAGGNESVGSINWQEGVQMPSTVNNSARQMMADTRASFNEVAGGWFEYGDGSATYTPTYVGATQFRIDGVDVSAVYMVGRRVKLTAPTPGTIYGTISAVSFSTNTTVTMVWDSGSLSSEAITAVYIGILPATNTAIPSLSSLALSSSAAGSLLTITSSDAGATSGPDQELYRDSASPAASDILGAVIFYGRDSAANKQEYGRINCTITDPTTTSEDSKVIISTVIAGTVTPILTLTAGVQIGAPTGGDKGAGTLNVATAYYINGQLTTQVIQVLNTQTGAVATGTTVMPFDDTIPQITEGDQYMSLAITPKNTNNILEITVVINLAISTAGYEGVALFQDATAGALASAVVTPGGNNYNEVVTFIHRMTAGTTSATTFRVRAGLNTAGTTTFNGNAAARIYGGVLASSITIREYTP